MKAMVTTTCAADSTRNAVYVGAAASTSSSTAATASAPTTRVRMGARRAARPHRGMAARAAARHTQMKVPVAAVPVTPNNRSNSCG
ncbi:hypothetical protein A6A08_06495 [Nocardiopsis sp. TSRI0078]|nr:hypothetical protein A6A08_06495 [Nocardiopsis sp. TSRI0078]